MKRYDVYISGYFAGTLELSTDHDTAIKQITEKLHKIGLGTLNTSIIELEEENE